MPEMNVCKPESEYIMRLHFPRLFSCFIMRLEQNDILTADISNGLTVLKDANGDHQIVEGVQYPSFVVLLGFLVHRDAARQEMIQLISLEHTNGVCVSISDCPEPLARVRWWKDE